MLSNQITTHFTLEAYIHTHHASRKRNFTKPPQVPFSLFAQAAWQVDQLDILNQIPLLHKSSDAIHIKHTGAFIHEYFSH